MKIIFNLIIILLSVYSFSFSQALNVENIQYITGDNDVKFLKKINDFGKVGYRLKSIVYASEKYSKNIRYAGLMEFVSSDEHFEYKSFYSNRISSIASSLASYQNDGFSVYDSLPILEDGDAPGCTEFDIGCAGTINEFDYQIVSGNLIFLERKNGVIEIPKHEFVAIKEKSWADYKLKIINTISEFQEKDYAPIKVLYTQELRNREFVFVMQKQLSTISDFRIVDEVIGFNKKINELSNDGFVLSSSLYLSEFYQMALLVRHPNTPLEISKILFPKDIKPKELLKTKMKFKSVLWSFNGYKRGYEKEKLQFIEPTDLKTEYSYKIVKMKELKPGKPIDSIEPSKEATSEYKSLVAQGYVIKDLYLYNGINMLLEKEIK